MQALAFARIEDETQNGNEKKWHVRLVWHDTNSARLSRIQHERKESKSSATDLEES